MKIQPKIEKHTSANFGNTYPRQGRGWNLHPRSFHLDQGPEPLNLQIVILQFKRDKKH